MSTLDFDQLNIFGSASILQNAVLEIDLANGFIPSEGDFFDLLTANQLDLSNLVDFDMPVIDGLTFDHQVLTLFDPSVGFDRDVLRFTFGATSVPEPNAILLLGFVAALFASSSRRFRNQARSSGGA